MRQRTLSQILACAAATVATLIATAGSAHASPSGYGWDGVDPSSSTASPCSGSVSTKKSADIYVAGSRVGKIELRYSSACRTVWGRLLINTVPSDGGAEIRRVSDGRVDYCTEVPKWSSTTGAWTCFTTMLYDGGVTSQAYGVIVLPGIGTGNAGTAAY